MKNSTPLVSIISINYNHSSDTVVMLESLKKCSYSNIEIIIVDNASCNDNIAAVEEIYTDVKLVRLAHNLGFAGGNNEGIRYATGEYILLLNNDTVVDANFLEPLVEQMQNNADAGMVSPRLLYYNSPNMKTIQYAGATQINLFTGRGFSVGWGEVDTGQYDYTKKTDYAHGAALLFSRKVLDLVGCMPDIYFLYYEEHDWCTAMRKRGLNAYYVGKSKVYHKASVSVGENSPIKTYFMIRNRIIYLRRNAGWMNFAIAISFILSISSAKAIVEFIKRKQTHLIPFYIKGILWNFCHPKNLKGFPRLVSNNKDLPDLIASDTGYEAHAIFVRKNQE